MNTSYFFHRICALCTAISVCLTVYANLKMTYALVSRIILDVFLHKRFLHHKIPTNNANCSVMILFVHVPTAEIHEMHSSLSVSTAYFHSKYKDPNISRTQHFNVIYQETHNTLLQFLFLIVSTEKVACINSLWNSFSW